jgi:ribosomal protein S18 acetylase RimI-like enzyme
VPRQDLQVAIRLATMADVPAIAAVHLASWRAAYSDITPVGFMDTVTIESRIVRWEGAFTGPASHTTETIIAVGDDGVLGICSFGPRRDPESHDAGEIYSLHVAPASWRRGYGRMLLDDALARLAARGFESAVLWVLSDNCNARAFYEAQGWSLTGEDQREARSGFAIPEVRYSIQVGG